MLKILAAAALVATTGMAAQAAQVTPDSYTMPNGNTGSFWYFDDSYDGSGNKTSPNATLSGGTGDLTDGVIATQNWHQVEGPANTPVGPYVGWTLNPTITFFFDQVTDFVSATFYFDDSGGNGGVSAPLSVSLAGVGTQNVANPPGIDPFAFTFDLGGVSSDQLAFTINRGGSWVFLSEVEFEANMTAAVPLPAGVGLLATALGGLGFLRMRRRTA